MNIEKLHVDFLEEKDNEPGAYYAGVYDFKEFIKKQKNSLSFMNDIKCPRVMLRLECEQCGYPASEALYTNFGEDRGEISKILIPCKYELVKNEKNVESNYKKLERIKR